MLLCSLRFWELNAELGVLLDKDGRVNRRGTVVYHCLKVSEIIEACKKKSLRYYRNSFPIVYRVEGGLDLLCKPNGVSKLPDHVTDYSAIGLSDDFEEISETGYYISFTKPKLEQKFGVGLADIISKLVYDTFGCLKPKAFDHILRRTSCWRYKEIGSNWKSKRFLADLNYIYEMAGLPRMTHIDRKVKHHKRMEKIHIPKCLYTQKREIIKYDPREASKGEKNLKRAIQKHLSLQNKNSHTSDKSVGCMSKKMTKLIQGKKMVFTETKDIIDESMILANEKLKSVVNPVNYKDILMKNVCKDINFTTDCFLKIKKKEKLKEIVELRDELKSLSPDKIDAGDLEKNKWLKPKRPMRNTGPKKLDPTFHQNMYEKLNDYIEKTNSETVSVDELNRLKKHISSSVCLAIDSNVENFNLSYKRYKSLIQNSVDSNHRVRRSLKDLVNRPINAGVPKIVVQSIETSAVADTILGELRPQYGFAHIDRFVKIKKRAISKNQQKKQKKKDEKAIQNKYNKPKVVKPIGGTKRCLPSTTGNSESRPNCLSPPNGETKSKKIKLSKKGENVCVDYLKRRLQQYVYNLKTKSLSIPRLIEERSIIISDVVIRSKAIEEEIKLGKKVKWISLKPERVTQIDAEIKSIEESIKRFKGGKHCLSHMDIS